MGGLPDQFRFAVLCPAAGSVALIAIGASLEGGTLVRYVALAASLLFASASVPVSAATLVQFDSEFGAFAGFAPFDPSLGTLNSVTLEVELWRPRTWMLDVPADEPSSADVQWTVDGYWLLPASAATGGAGIAVPLTGSGTSTVSMDLLAEGRAFGFFAVDAYGAASLLLDPSAFFGGRVFFNGYDPAYFGDVGDTHFTVAGDHGLTMLGSACMGFDGPYPEAEDLCGATSYTLTYDYTPAVPEPGTWAMMLLGFAGTGLALRRRRRMEVTA